MKSQFPASAKRGTDLLFESKSIHLIAAREADEESKTKQPRFGDKYLRLFAAVLSLVLILSRELLDRDGGSPR